MSNDVHVEIARAALVRALKMDPSIRAAHEWHVCFIDGYVSAIRAMNNGNPALLVVPDEASAGYRAGWEEALKDYGVLQ